jgi:hypothetical protein
LSLAGVTGKLLKWNGSIGLGAGFCNRILFTESNS